MTVWWAIWIGVAVVAILVLSVPAAFMLDRWYLADPSSTDIVTAVVVFRASRARGPWRYGEIWRAWHQKGQDHCLASSAFVRENRKAYLVDPGILARRNQFEPMFSVIEREGYDIYTLDYTQGMVYDRERSSTWVAVLVKQLLATYDEVVYDGISHGGNHAFFVGEKLGGDVDKLSKVILHDAPYGAATMKQMPGFASGLFRFTAGKLADTQFNWVLQLLLRMGKPKRENIVMPNSEDLEQLGLPRNTSEDAFCQHVENQAKVNLSGHRFPMWYSELGDMGEVGRTGLPFGVFGNVPVVYIRYLGDKNDVVAQPAASEVFQSEVPHLRMIDVQGGHAAFLEQFEANTGALYEALMA